VDSDPGVLAGLPASGTIFLSEERHDLHFCDGTTGAGYCGNSYDSVFSGEVAGARERILCSSARRECRYSSSNVAHRRVHGAGPAPSDALTRRAASGTRQDGAVQADAGSPNNLNSGAHAASRRSGSCRENSSATGRSLRKTAG
jgi:hypothetical protein